MDQTSQLLLLVGAAFIGLLALVLITGRQRRDRAAATQESPFATSTEGE
jgi:LPXTG-motif cell wall-anchored protein